MTLAVYHCIIQEDGDTAHFTLLWQLHAQIPCALQYSTNTMRLFLLGTATEFLLIVKTCMCILRFLQVFFHHLLLKISGFTHKGRAAYLLQGSNAARFPLLVLYYIPSLCTSCHWLCAISVHMTTFFHLPHFNLWASQPLQKGRKSLLSRPWILNLKFMKPVPTYTYTKCLYIEFGGGGWSKNLDGRKKPHL